MERAAATYCTVHYCTLHVVPGNTYSTVLLFLRILYTSVLSLTVQYVLDSSGNSGPNGCEAVCEIVTVWNITESRTLSFAKASAMNTDLRFESNVDEFLISFQQFIH